LTTPDKAKARKRGKATPVLLALPLFLALALSGVVKGLK
jgi:hypothetical protein